jgi:hypothetical protein
MQNVLCISCYFGNNKISIHPAPKLKNCVFFSNNIDVKEEALQNGWRFEYVPKELSSDPVMSSLQSKYIKFLIFLQDFERYRSYSKILYWDHHLEVDFTHLEKVLTYDSVDDISIVIREHENLSRKNVWDEIEEASNQERYRKHMQNTIHFIGNKPTGKVCNTGFIFYKNYECVLDMLQDIYDACCHLQQPCCQIFWSVYSPKYSHKIHMIPFRELYPTNSSWVKLGYFP